MPTRRSLSRGLWLVGLGMLAGVADASVAVAADPATVMIVFDGSGSMWGKLDGEKQTKFVNGRDAIKAAFGKLKGEPRIGLLSFGHRRQGDCADVQVIVPADTATADKINGALEKLNPKGKGPLTAALKEAAKAIGKAAGPKSLIVLHDDADNCSADPCAALAELQASAPGLVVHVVGLGLKGEDAQRLQCLVRPTKGRLVEAQDAGAVTAAIDDMIMTASLDGAAPAKPAATATPTVAIAPTAPPAALAPALKPGERAPLQSEGPPALRLATLLAPGQAPLPRAVTFTVIAEDTPTPPPRMARGQNVLLALPPGRYSVEARDGLVTMTQPVTVGAKGQIGQDLILNAGLVRFANTTAPTDAFVAVLEAVPEPGKADRAGKPLGIVALAATSQGLAIPAGKWIIRLDQGEARVERAVTVTAGQVIDLPTVVPFGRLQITVAGRDTASRTLPVVHVLEDDPDAPRGRREITRSAAASTDFVLPAGTYTVLVRQGAVETRERLNVAASDTVKRTVTLAGARLTLSSRLTGGVPGDDPITYRVERVDVVPPEVFIANNATTDLSVPAGRYRIEARHGLVNARARRDIDLTAGQQANVAFEQQAGIVQFAGPPNQQGDLIWEILDADGRLVWSTAQLNPRAVLQAGKYQVRAEGRDKRYERPLDVRPGQTTVLQMRD